MRLWSLHPHSLDRQGLVACWREALLAQKVLQGLTRGYRNHPQLQRFRALEDPVEGIGSYLSALADEADVHRYRFNRALIVAPGPCTTTIDVHSGQLAYERWLLDTKLTVRGNAGVRAAPGDLTPHPLFRTVPGSIEEWEKVRPEFGPA